MDWWAHEVVLSYDRKFKKLYSLFAADVVGEDRTSNVVESFAAEKARFFRGQVSIRYRLVWAEPKSVAMSYIFYLGINKV